jgi:tetratricopeptide (TPR) repeat protein
MTRQEPAAIDEIHRDLENIRAGWHWAAATLLDPASPLAGAVLIARYAPMLSYYFERRSRFLEGVQIFQRVAKMMEDAGWHELPDHEPATLDRQLAVARVGIAEATLCFRLGQLSRAEQLARRCISLMRKPQLADGLAGALVLLGRVLARKGAYEQATTCFVDSLDLSQQHHDLSHKGLAFSGLASIASNQGKFDEAEAYFTQSIALFREIDYPREVAINLNNLGANFVRRNQARRAHSLCQEALAIAKTLDEDLLLAVVLSGLGSTARVLHEYDQARSYLAQSLQISRRLGDQRWTTTNLNLLGLTWFDAGDAQVARPYLVEALETAISIGSMPDALDSLAALAEIAEDDIRLEQRFTTLHFVIAHPATRAHALERGKRVLAKLQEQGAPTPWTAAVERAGAHTLASLAAEYLASSRRSI